MPTPLICTTDTLGHIDYGVPIIASKSTDYRTSNRLYHPLVPNIPQEFDCRVKKPLKAELKICEVEIRDDKHKSVYATDYVTNDPDKNNNSRPPLAAKTDYTRNVQEHVFKHPPPPVKPAISVMKDSYTRMYSEFPRRECFPPEPYAKCEVKALGRDEQPAIRPGDKGYWKLTDPYLTTNALTYVPFTKDDQNGVARKDIVTFYDASNVPKGKGFGPRNGPAVEPLVSRKKIPMEDKHPFKLSITGKIVYEPLKNVPHSAMTSTTKSTHVRQTFSVMYPYLFQNGEEYGDSLANASPWQNLAPPNMYCSEYCHIGTGWPVNAAIYYALPPEYYLHKPCFTKFRDDSQ